MYQYLTGSARVIYDSVTCVRIHIITRPKYLRRQYYLFSYNILCWPFQQFRVTSLPRYADISVRLNNARQISWALERGPTTAQVIWLNKYYINASRWGAAPAAQEQPAGCVVGRTSPGSTWGQCRPGPSPCPSVGGALMSTIARFFLQQCGASACLNFANIYTNIINCV